MIMDIQHINICGMQEKIVFKYKLMALNGYNKKEKFKSVICDSTLIN